jgi:hypothetical protein
MRPEEFVRRYRLDHLVCSFSGGRDSLVAHEAKCSFYLCSLAILFMLSR